MKLTKGQPMGQWNTRCVLVRSVIALYLSFSSTALLAADPSTTIGLLISGSADSTQKFLGLVEKEIHSLLDEGPNHPVKIESRVLPYNASEGDYGQTTRSLEGLKGIRAVVALDPVSSYELRKTSHTKHPVLTPVQLPTLLQEIKSDLLRFKSLSPISSVTVLADPAVIKRIPHIEDAFSKMGSELGLAVHIRSLPEEGVSAVYFSSLYSPSISDSHSLIQGLTQNKVLTYSGRGSAWVQDGAFVGMSDGLGSSRQAELARQIARTIQDQMTNGRSRSGALNLSAVPRLALNVDTARNLGISPLLSVLREAEVFGENGAQSANHEGAMSLRESALEAVKNNLDLSASQFGSDAEAEKVGLARSKFFPQLDLGLSYLQLDSNIHQASSGTIPDYALAGQVVGRQLIYSEREFAALSIAKYRTEAHRQDTEHVKLHVVNEVIQAHLSVLLARRQIDLSQDNLDRTQANLNSAEAKFSAGRSNRSDVYRWESLLAQAKKTLFNAQMTEKAAEVSYNRILHRPLGDPVNIQDVGLDYPDVWISGIEFKNTFTTADKFTLLERFLIHLSLENAPEVKSLHAQREATDRALTSYKSKFFLPELYAQGIVAHSFASDAANSGSTILLPGLPVPLTLPSLNSTQWAISLNLTYNIFSGGADAAHVREESEKLHQLEVQESSAHDEIETTLRRNLLKARAAYLAIDLDRKSAEAADQSYGLVRKAYIQGANSITDLIDAQNSALTARISSASAIYYFYEAYFNVLRAVGKYDLLQSDQERREFTAKLTALGNNK